MSEWVIQTGIEPEHPMETSPRVPVYEIVVRKSRLETALSRAREAEDREQLVRKALTDAALERDTRTVEVERLRDALKTAADDLDKAANQFAGALPEGENERLFAGKAERARAALEGKR